MADADGMVMPVAKALDTSNRSGVNPRKKRLESKPFFHESNRGNTNIPDRIPEPWLRDNEGYLYGLWTSFLQAAVRAENLPIV